jgi:hypothetical protein
MVALALSFADLRSVDQLFVENRELFARLFYFMKGLKGATMEVLKF